MRIVIISVAIVAGMASTRSHAANCDLHDLLLKDVSAINQSNESQLAFVLGSTEEQYNEAKKNGAAGGAYALFAGSLTYTNALVRARGIADATKFDYKSSYARSIFDQNVTQSAVKDYVTCIGKSPGLYMWLQSRKGDFLTFGALWNSPDSKTLVSPYDTAPVVDGGRIVGKPDAWQSGRQEEIVVRREGNSDVYLNVKVNGQSVTQIIVKDPPPVSWERAPVTSKVLMKTGSHGPNPGCSAGEVADCIFPLHPGGALISDSAALVDRNSSDPSTYGETFYLKSSTQICVKMRQSTGACEVAQTAQGRLTALEEFPRAE